MQFINVKTDFAFKKVFGSAESKDILISFLNAILNLKNNVIESLTIINPYQIPLSEGLKETYVDIQAKLENGTTVLIEMQTYNQGGFGNRIQSNLAKAYSTQLRSGDKYTKHNRVVALTVTDFLMFNDEKLKSTVITHFEFMERTKLVLFPYNKMEMVFVELPKFDKKEDELVTMADKWIYFIKQAGDFSDIPQSLVNEKNITDALKIANYATLTPEELDIEEKKSRWLADQEEIEFERQIVLDKLSQMKVEKQAVIEEKQAVIAENKAVIAEKQAVEKALAAEKETAKTAKMALEKAEQLIQQAEQNTKLQIAKQMLQNKIDITLIMQATGLEAELIRKLSVE